MQILEETGFNLHVIKLINRLYIDQNVRMGLDQWETGSVNIGKELDKGGVCHRFYSTYLARTLPRELLRGLETSEWKDKEFTLRDMQMPLYYWLMKERCYRA